MGKKLLNFDPINAEAGDFVYGGRSGRSPEEEMRIPVENLSNAGASLTAGRLAFKELVSETLSVDGWYTIAELDNTTIGRSLADFYIISDGSGRQGSYSFKAGLTVSNNARNHGNTIIKYTGFTTFNSGIFFLPGVRIAKSDSINNAGGKLQVYVDASVSITLTIQKSSNIGDIKGWELVTPFLDNTPTLPDGVTAGTFLEAGEELSFENASAYIFSNFVAFRGTDDQIRCVVIWPEIPKQGTDLTITLPSSLFEFRGTGEATAGLVTFTISNFEIDGKHVIFRINQTGIASGLSSGPLFPYINGTGCKLTIT